MLQREATLFVGGDFSITSNSDEPTKDKVIGVQIGQT
jgi:hypothetical protein